GWPATNAGLRPASPRGPPGRRAGRPPARQRPLASNRPFHPQSGETSMATLLRQMALVSESPSINFSDLARVSAALQKQAERDLSPVGDISATVDAFAKLEDVPVGYWPIIIRDDIGFDAAGIHLDKDNQPFALVTSGDGWSVTASHEALEMLVDPFGNR